MGKTTIEWTSSVRPDGTVVPGYTGNLWWGCHEIHLGCDNCYARTFDKRVGGAHWGAHAPRRIIDSVWSNFASWQRKAAQLGEVHRVFVGSMMDIFERSQSTVTIKGEPTGVETKTLRQRFFDEVVPASPNLLFLLLTKRPHNIKRMVPPAWLITPPANVMYGYSAVNQPTADQGVPHLLAVPGRHFLSCEPLLGPVDLFHVGDEDWDVLRGWKAKASNERGWANTPLIDWIIAGGESGHKARPPHPDWFRSLRDQCTAAGIPFHFKQFGEWGPLPTDWYGDVQNVCRECGKHSHTMCGHCDHDWRGQAQMVRLGKHAAGRTLDERTWDEFPVVEAR